MRRLIPYVASNFRKDRIWLRRTKKTERDYQILMAIDDSSSMADNDTKQVVLNNSCHSLEMLSFQLTFESLCLLGNALTQIEVGRLSVCKFGASVTPLYTADQQPFNDDAAARILSQLTFEQSRTDVCQV